MKHARRVYDKLIMRPLMRHFGRGPHARDYEKSRAIDPAFVFCSRSFAMANRVTCATKLERANGMG